MGVILVLAKTRRPELVILPSAPSSACSQSAWAPYTSRNGVIDGKRRTTHNTSLTPVVATDPMVKKLWMARWTQGGRCGQVPESRWG